MESYLIFSIGLILLIGIVIIYSLKSVFDTSVLIKNQQQRLTVLKSRYKEEKLKSLLNNERMILMNDLNKTLFGNVLKITRELLLVQKIMFNKYF